MTAGAVAGRRRRSPSGRLLAVLIVLAVVSITACGGSDAGLDALEADPMSSFVPSGAELVAETSTAGGGAKDTPARISRRFRVDVGGMGAAVDSISAAAVDEGWEVGEVTAAGGLQASRRSGSRLLQLTVSTSPSSGAVLVDLLTTP